MDAVIIQDQRVVHHTHSEGPWPSRMRLFYDPFCFADVVAL